MHFYKKEPRIEIIELDYDTVNHKVIKTEGNLYNYSLGDVTEIEEANSDMLKIFDLKSAHARLDQNKSLPLIQMSPKCSIKVTPVYPKVSFNQPRSNSQ